jgi:polyhydroxyalkanoate synthesis repressor PhaR
MLVKKYPNRRLYDTLESRYITLEELAEKIRAGADARVIDAKTDEDLTQQTLTQIILESRNTARLLPVPLLVQLVRMGDDALAEFFSRYVAWALEVYLATKQNALGFAGLGALLGTAPLRWLERADRGERLRPPWEEKAAIDTADPPSAPPEAAVAEVVPPAAGVLGLGEDVAALRRELDALKRTIRRKR